MAERRGKSAKAKQVEVKPPSGERMEMGGGSFSRIDLSLKAFLVDDEEPPDDLYAWDMGYHLRLWMHDEARKRSRVRLPDSMKYGNLTLPDGRLIQTPSTVYHGGGVLWPARVFSLCGQPTQNFLYIVLRHWLYDRTGGEALAQEYNKHPAWQAALEACRVVWQGWLLSETARLLEKYPGFRSENDLNDLFYFVFDSPEVGYEHSLPLPQDYLTEYGFTPSPPTVSHFNQELFRICGVPEDRYPQKRPVVLPVRALLVESFCLAPKFVSPDGGIAPPSEGWGTVLSRVVGNVHFAGDTVFKVGSVMSRHAHWWQALPQSRIFDIALNAGRPREVLRLDVEELLRGEIEREEVVQRHLKRALADYNDSQPAVKVRRVDDLPQGVKDEARREVRNAIGNAKRDKNRLTAM